MGSLSHLCRAVKARLSDYSQIFVDYATKLDKATYFVKAIFTLTLVCITHLGSETHLKIKKLLCFYLNLLRFK